MGAEGQQGQQGQTGVGGAAGPSGQEPQTGQPQQGQAQGQQPGQQGGQDPKVGAAFAAQRQNLEQQHQSEVENLRSQVNNLTQQLQLYQANMAMGMQGGYGPPQPQGQPAAPPPDPVKAVLGEDIRDDDPLTAADMRKILAMHEQGLAQTVQALQFQISAPDFNEMIGTHLQEILQTDPMARQTLATMRRDNPQGAKQFAYQLCKMRDQYLKGGGTGQPQTGGQPQGGGPQPQGGQVDPAQQAQQIMEHMTNPGSGGLAQAGGGGGSHSAAEAYSNMNEDELEARIAAVKANV